MNFVKIREEEGGGCLTGAHMGRWQRVRCDTSSPWHVQADRASSRFGHSAHPHAQGGHHTLGCGGWHLARYTNGEGVADPPSPLRQSRDSWALSLRDTWLCVVFQRALLRA